MQVIADSSKLIANQQKNRFSRFG